MKQATKSVSAIRKSDNMGGPGGVSFSCGVTGSVVKGNDEKEEKRTTTCHAGETDTVWGMIVQGAWKERESVGDRRETGDRR